MGYATAFLAVAASIGLAARSDRTDAATFVRAERRSVRQITGTPLTSSGGVVAANADGRLELFVVAGGGVIRHAWQPQPSGGPWSRLQDLPGQSAGGGAPSVIANVDGRLEVFRIGDDARIEHTWQEQPNGSWHAFERLTPSDAGSVKTFVVARNADGRLEVFLQRCAAGIQCSGQPEPVEHVWQTSAGGPWTQPSRLSAVGYGAFVALSAGADGSGQLHVIVAEYFGPSPALDEWLQNGGWHRNPIRGVEPASVPIGATFTVNADGRAEMFIGQSAVKNAWQSSPGGPMGSALTEVGPPLAEPTNVAAGRNQDGRLEIAWYQSSTGRVTHQWQTVPGGGWSAAETFSSQACPNSTAFANALQQNSDGRLEIFVSCNGTVAHAWQGSPGGAWSPFAHDIT